MPDKNFALLLLKTLGGMAVRMGPWAYFRPQRVQTFQIKLMALRSTYQWTAAMVLGLSMVACGGGSQSDQPPVQDDTLTTAADQDGVVKVGNKIFSIPSPVQTILLANELKATYASDLLLPADGLPHLATKEKRALVLGMYGADLAYAATFQDGQRSLKILKVVESLSGQLNLSNALGKDMVDGFKQHLGNRDSLLRFTGEAFRSADKFLKNDQQDDVSALVLAGGWVESLHLTLGASGGKVDPRVATRLAEQRHTLENLIAMLEQQGGGPELLAALKQLAVPYAEVVSTYTYVEPTVDAAQRTTYINSKTSAQIAPEAVQAIIQQVRAIRASIIA